MDRAPNAAVQWDMTQRIDSTDVTIRPFEAGDQAAVAALFVAVNRDLAPPDRAAAFESYIARSLDAEIGDIARYYDRHRGWFFCATVDHELVGMFGLEPRDGSTVELRRMYVALAHRRLGLGRALLVAAEEAARAEGFARLVLSTSAIQEQALGLYGTSGFREVRVETEPEASHKALGGGLTRYHFEKAL